jgi:diguanylate cyclase (GGDEF)-like protein/PAS domain S-box-containing protein
MAIAEMGGDQHGRLLRTNDALCRLLGRPASAMRRYSFADLVHPEDVGTLLRTSAEGGRAELRLGRRDGTYVWVSLRNSVVADTADGPRFLLTHVDDIDERKHRELTLERRACHDALTGLLSETELYERLRGRLCDGPTDEEGDARDSDGFGSAWHNVHHHRDEPESGRVTLAVLHYGINGFRSINHRFGRAAGNTVLIEIAHRLRNDVTFYGDIARVRGDEFVVLADDLDSSAAAGLAVQLGDSFRRPISVGIGRETVRPDVSSVLCWASCGTPADQILWRAGELLHEKKRLG